jgi:hypothetical protein
MEVNRARDDRAESEQRGQVKNIRTDDHADADAELMLGESGYR